MDKPTTPAGPNASNSPWPEDSGSGQDFGATGIFGTVNAPEPVKDFAESSPEPDPLAKWLTEPATAQPQAAPQTLPETWPQPLPPAPQPAPAPKEFTEPVVHKVVFGGGAAENSPELLDRLRAASAERAAAEKVPAAETGSKGSGGFTELLRTLGTEPPAPPVVQRETPRPAQDSGFTSLLKTLETPVVSFPVEAPFKPVPPAAPAPGGFTELLRATTPDASEFDRPQTPSSGFGDAPGSGGAPAGSKPGAFTQLFGTLGGAGTTETAPPVPPTSSSFSAGSSGAGPGSFTRMLSLEQQSEQQSAPAPPFHEVPKPIAGSSDYGAAPRTESPAVGLDPFASSPLPEAPPIQNTPAGSGVGITRLIQMLDEPSRAPAPHFEPARVSQPPGPEPGVWTQTFASLAESNKPAAAPAKTPEWSSPPPAYPAAPVSPPAFEPVLNKPASPGPSGPSEFTRILDASKMRELSMRGGAAATSPASVPAPPQSFAPPAPQVPMPNYPMPVAPTPMARPGMGGMPQPGGFAPPQPPQVPNYPMNFGPQAGGMPAVGGSMPQAPGMYAPPVPVPPVPQAPPVKAPDPGAGKTQQLLLIMGAVIIVLLVAILVTVIFLMRH